MRNLLTTLMAVIQGVIVMYIDNEAARKLTRNPEFYVCTKHIALRYHFIREQTLAGNVNPVYIPTADNIADMLTKPLARPLFERLRDIFVGAGKNEL